MTFQEENDAAYNSPVHSESDQFDSDFGSSDESDEPIDDDESVAKQEKKTTGGKKIYKVKEDILDFAGL